MIVTLQCLNHEEILDLESTIVVRVYCMTVPSWMLFALYQYAESLAPEV